jgi:hypothetical protein
MASGHVNRTKRPNTWLHRPMLQREKALANSEPSTHGTRLTSPSDKSASGETADNKCSGRACPLLTQSRCRLGEPFEPPRYCEWGNYYAGGAGPGVNFSATPFMQ